jgi:hypothetical protein
MLSTPPHIFRTVRDSRIENIQRHGPCTAPRMAIDSDKILSDPYREILVTDIEWRFDYGEHDAATLREGDVIDRTSEPGWVLITLQSLVPGGFPEIVRHQVCKIISERHRLRRMRIKADPPGGTTEGGASGFGPADPTPGHSGALRIGGIGAPEGPQAPTPPAPPIRRDPAPRRRGSVPSDGAD